ncbi:MAG: hypothetical protein COB49_00500 [Alphaproteobacteria bacterium]|nr:MAG: hypothetical protein COB49_00500 [Alphaproteobacteria bacterium]
MSALAIFDFEETAVRSLIGEDGEPWFVARDICQCLELTNVSQALARLDDDEVDDIILNDVAGRKNKMKVVNEPGAYILTFASRSKSAKKFKKWIAHVVLPAIRKTGQYIAPANANHPEVHLRQVVEYDLAAVQAYAPWQKEVRIIYGKEAARQYMKKLPVPQVDDLPAVELIIRKGSNLPDTVTSTTFNEMLDGSACLDHLLAQSVSSRDDHTVGCLILDSLHGGMAADRLKPKGMMINPPGWDGYLAIGVRHKFLTACFSGTLWHTDWAMAMLTLPNVRATDKPIIIETQVKAVLIPISEIVGRHLD